jgi:hypothetical protein
MRLEKKGGRLAFLHFLLCEVRISTICNNIILPVLGESIGERGHF